MGKMRKKPWYLPLPLVFLWFSIIHSDPNSSANLTCEYEVMTKFLQEVADNYRQIAQLVTIGTTEEGRELWTMILSDSPYKRPLLRPQAKFVGNINGMSGSACYVLLRLIKHLVEEYKSEASMERKLLESVEIHVIPNLNPDGYARAVPGSCYGKDGRYNSNRVNLNTNFPDIFQPDEFETMPVQKETDAMIRWMNMNKFTISVSLISGAKVVVYPFDTIIVDDESEHFPQFGEQHLTPDDDIFKHLALTYASKTGAPEMGWYCHSLKRQFPLGIVNGAEWQPQSGTMMDFNYIHGTFEIMAGISCCRNEVNSTFLEEMWWENREGLLHVIHVLDRGGIRGQILDAETYDAIADANLSKREHDYLEGEESIYSMPWYTTKDGEFWRPWRPGAYKLRVEASGYKTKLVDVQVHHHQPTFIRVEMEKETIVNATISHEKLTTSTTTTVATSSSTSVYLREGEGQVVAQNESIKKMSGSHQPDDFASDKRDTLTNGHQQEFTTITTTTMVTGIMETTENESVVQEKPILRSSTSTKHYSSLTQLDHSFINLFRGNFGLRNSSSSSIKEYYSVFKIITMCLLVGFLMCCCQLAATIENFNFDRLI